MNADNWAVFGVFVGVWVVTVIVAAVVTIMRRKNNFAFWTLIVGGVLRCVALLPVSTYGEEIVSDIAGLLFFSSCCIVLTQVVRNFHEKRDCPNSVYHPMVFVLIGYNVLFYILELCVAGLMIYVNTTHTVAKAAVDAEDEEDSTVIIYDKITQFIICILFGFSFLFLGATYIVVFFMLRNSWIYFKKIVAFCKKKKKSCIPSPHFIKQYFLFLLYLKTLLRLLV